ncbi:hypothetical protein W909_13335 [Dickeya zeae EC1]|nr:hypothetical protein W909_13335 [Dickeya zeae EC1]
MVTHDTRKNNVTFITKKLKCRFLSIIIKTVMNITQNTHDNNGDTT